MIRTIKAKIAPSSGGAKSQKRPRKPARQTFRLSRRRIHGGDPPPQQQSILDALEASEKALQAILLQLQIATGEAEIKRLQEAEEAERIKLAKSVVASTETQKKEITESLKEAKKLVGDLSEFKGKLLDGVEKIADNALFAAAETVPPQLHEVAPNELIMMMVDMMAQAGGLVDIIQQQSASAIQMNEQQLLQIASGLVSLYVYIQNTSLVKDLNQTVNISIVNEKDQQIQPYEDVALPIAIIATHHQCMELLNNPKYKEQEEITNPIIQGKLRCIVLNTVNIGLKLVAYAAPNANNGDGSYTSILESSDIRGCDIGDIRGFCIEQAEQAKSLIYKES